VINPVEKVSALNTVVSACNIRRMIRSNEAEVMFQQSNSKFYERIPDPYYTPFDEND
jgi:hypothetical protein